MANSYEFISFIAHLFTSHWWVNFGVDLILTFLKLLCFNHSNSYEISSQNSYVFLWDQLLYIGCKGWLFVSEMNHAESKLGTLTHHDRIKGFCSTGTLTFPLNKLLMRHELTKGETKQQNHISTPCCETQITFYVLFGAMLLLIHQICLLPQCFSVLKRYVFSDRHLIHELFLADRKNAL